MSSFQHYLHPETNLEERMRAAFAELHIQTERAEEIRSFLDVLKIKDKATYEHSIRVGLLCRNIGQFMHLDQKPLLYAGLLHDVGKAQTDPKTLKKTSGWTEADTAEIRSHVMDGYRLIRGHFDFTAEIILWHHRFQPNSYPAESPELLHEYSQGTKVMIPFFGRVLALADHYDASHRVNDKYATDGNVGKSIKRRIIEHNPDQGALIEELYQAGILTTEIFSEDASVA